jgi:hypothetical protein
MGLWATRGPKPGSGGTPGKCDYLMVDAMRFCLGLDIFRRFPPTEGMFHHRSQTGRLQQETFVIFALRCVS